MANQNLFSVVKKVDTKDKNKLLKQQAIVVWFVGLSGSGKSTIACELEQELYRKGFYTKLLDGDDLRMRLCSDLGFGGADRIENIRRAAEVAKLFMDNGTIVLSSFISPTHHIRSMIKDIIGKENGVEVFIDCSLEECERRDVKGLYKKARAGQLKEFTGISSPFERPVDSDIVINTEKESLVTAVEKLIAYILPKIILK